MSPGNRWQRGFLFPFEKNSGSEVGFRGKVWCLIIDVCMGVEMSDKTRAIDLSFLFYVIYSDGIELCLY